ncbi:MAG TPA: hypothetical protein PL112_15700 [Candidatus Obscuribacter sp.]|nr:hypothetical protein [Candidatus Obscuribacter sp.]HNH75116.1 hypothetical protein [Candidatus Obscuribacter sp.]
MSAKANLDEIIFKLDRNSTTHELFLEDVLAVLNILPNQDKQIIALRVGLFHRLPKSRSLLASELGMPEERIEEAERALLKLIKYKSKN